MLVLSRLQGQEIIITTRSGETIRIVQVDCRAGKSRLGIEADKSVIIDRKEIHELRANKAA